MTEQRAGAVRESTGVHDQRRLRDILGHFGSGVTVVTAATPEGPVGFTCQSFSALSLDPPQILICPSRTSTSWPSIRSAGIFCVNVLAIEQQPISDQFARSGSAKFEGVEWAPTQRGTPMLTRSTAWFEVELNAEHQGGDHTIVVADVLDLGADSSRPALIFGRGRYHRTVSIDS